MLRFSCSVCSSSSPSASRHASCSCMIASVRDSMPDLLRPMASRAAFSASTLAHMASVSLFISAPTRWALAMRRDDSSASNFAMRASSFSASVRFGAEAGFSSYFLARAALACWYFSSLSKSLLRCWSSFFSSAACCSRLVRWLLISASASDVADIWAWFFASSAARFFASASLALLWSTSACSSCLYCSFCCFSRLLLIDPDAMSLSASAILFRSSAIRSAAVESRPISFTESHAPDALRLMLAHACSIKPRFSTNCGVRLSIASAQAFCATAAASEVLP